MGSHRAPAPEELALADVLDLLDQHVYAGEVTPDGHYVAHSFSPTLAAFIGGEMPEGVDRGRLWESRIHADDWQEYERFNQRLLAGEDAEVTYRLSGVDGVERVLWDRARPRHRADGSMLVHGIISNVTARAEADAQLAEASERFTTLLDVVGEHAYVALAFPDGRIEELFQGPGADRLLGGATPDAEMENWEAALHPEDRAAYEAFNRKLGAGEASDVEYRLIGADGITRWVHDRAATRRREDGTVEISGIVSDVTERRRMRADLAAAHAELSRVVAAMDDHLYTLRVDAAGGYTDVYRGPHREALAGGPLPGGADDERLWETLLHPDDRPLRRAALARLADGEAIELEYRVVGLDGRARTVLDLLRPRREADGTLYYDGVARDITERRELEARLRRSVADMHEAHRELEQARAAAELRARTDALTGAFNRRHFAEVAAARLSGGTRGCALLLLDADHFKHINDEHGHVVGDAVLIELARRLDAETGAGECFARWGGEEFALLLEGVRTDVELEQRAQRLRAMVAHEPVVAGGVTVRLTVSIGAVREGEEPTTLDALVETADRCLYVAKRQGRDRVSLVAEPIPAGAAASEPEGLSMARALAFAASARDATPEAHAGEVALLATLTAERLQLPAEIVLRCRLGGWLHDVGKLGVSERILEKPDALDAAEWALVRTHPVVGADIVRRFAALRTAADAVRHHHERYDGSGYPDGLAGAEIPIEARVVAAADTYAAMTADRVYSAAWSPAEAAAELRRSAGSHLDPDVVASLLDVLGPLVLEPRAGALSTRR